MKNLIGFTCCFNSFEGMFNETNLSNFVIRFYDDDGIANEQVVIGYTKMNNDFLLHLVSSNDCLSMKEGYAEANNQISFQLLSNLIGKDGFAIVDIDQFDDDDDDDDSERTETGECHCGNINDEDSLYCSCRDCYEREILKDCQYHFLFDIAEILNDVLENPDNVDKTKLQKQATDISTKVIASMLETGENTAVILSLIQEMLKNRNQYKEN